MTICTRSDLTICIAIREVADPLTKEMAEEVLLNVLRSGSISLWGEKQRGAHLEVKPYRRSEETELALVVRHLDALLSDPSSNFLTSLSENEK